MTAKNIFNNNPEHFYVNPTMKTITPRVPENIGLHDVPLYMKNMICYRIRYLLIKNLNKFIPNQKSDPPHRAHPAHSDSHKSR
jgi:hypothetical protein